MRKDKLSNKIDLELRVFMLLSLSNNHARAINNLTMNQDYQEHFIKKIRNFIFIIFINRFIALGFLIKSAIFVDYLRSDMFV